MPTTIVAGVVALGSAVLPASLAGGVVAAAVGGAMVGAAVGGVSAAIRGKPILKGMLKGGVIGGVVGAGAYTVFGAGAGAAGAGAAGGAASSTAGATAGGAAGGAASSTAGATAGGVGLSGGTGGLLNAATTTTTTTGGATAASSVVSKEALTLGLASGTATGLLQGMAAKDAAKEQAQAQQRAIAARRVENIADYTSPRVRFDAPTAMPPTVRVDLGLPQGTGDTSDLRPFSGQIGQGTKAEAQRPEYPTSDRPVAPVLTSGSAPLPQGYVPVDMSIYRKLTGGV